MTTPSERLRSARERAGYLKATDAARAFGWVPSTYMAHENGSRGISVDAAERYATAFRVSWSWLLKEDEGADLPGGLGVPVLYEDEPGSFKYPFPLEREHAEFIPVAVYGYDTAKLFAAEVKGSDKTEYMIFSPVETRQLYAGDVVLLKRRKGELEEIGSWMLNTGTLSPTRSGWAGAGPYGYDRIFVEDAAEVLGVAVAEYRLLRQNIDLAVVTISDPSEATE